MGHACKSASILFAGIALSACTTLVSPYDSTFDTSLNKLSEDTAVLVAAAKAGGSERKYNSAQAVAYYASTYNLLDRLSERAKQTRGRIPCVTNEGLTAFGSVESNKTPLPEDYRQFDCREAHLYSIRYYVHQLEYDHASGGVLSKYEAGAASVPLQTEIIGTILTFTANKPS